MTTVSDIKSLVNALGGARSVAQLIGVKPGAIYMAMVRGSIPYRWRIPLFQEAQARNISFDPALLGMQEAWMPLPQSETRQVDAETPQVDAETRQVDAGTAAPEAA